MFAALSVRSFRWLWTGQLLSQFGNAVFRVMALWEIQLKDPVLLAVAGLAMMSPPVLAAVGGVVVDRRDARRLMLWTDVMRGSAVLLGLLLLMVAPGWQPWIIIGLLAANALGNAVFNPAESVLLPTLVTDEQLPSANGLYALTFHLANAIGSGIGGTAVAAVGITVVFGFDVGSFWFSALAILLMMRLTLSTRSSVPDDGPSGLTSLRAGWGAVIGMRWFLILLPLILLGNLASNGGFLILPYWIHHHLHATATWYGLAAGAWGMGTVLGSLSAGRLGRFPLPRVVGLMGIAEGAFWLIFSLAHTPFMASAAFLVAGIASGVLNALVLTLLQRVIPSAVRGRVFGLLVSLLTAANPLAALLAGLSLTVIPPVVWYVAAAVSAVAHGVAFWMVVPRPETPESAIVETPWG